MKILFVGDSVTDAGSYRRPREEFTGYVKYAAELLGGGHEYFNHGISGNRSADLLERYERDIKAVCPDIMTLLIGINDVWRAFDSALYTPPEEFGRNVRELLRRTREDFPAVKIVMLEPFLLPIESKKYFRPLLAQVLEETRVAAEEYADALVPLDGLLNAARVDMDWREISADGVHPAERGAELIGRYLAEAVRSVLK